MSATEIALEHCEQRPSPHPPVDDFHFTNSPRAYGCLRAGYGGTQCPELVRLLFEAAIRSARDSWAKEHK